MKHKIQSENRRKPDFRIFGQIFDPVIPGIVAAGICSGFASLIAQFVPDYASQPIIAALYSLLTLVSTSFMGFMSAWVGYSACSRFGGTAILGGMLGMITGLDGINTLSQAVGWYNLLDPAASILCSGRGGIIAATLGAWIIAKLEKWMRARMPKSMDMVVTPFCVLTLVLLPYIFLVMPLTGLVSTGLCSAVRFFCMSKQPIVRIVAGYGCSALFLVAVMMGMQYAFVALYSMELDNFGYVTLFPTLAMAGAGQVGAGIALLLKAKAVHNEQFSNVIRASILPGMMGVGSPLLYGVTLPLGKPFITACLGGGFGGAFIMATGVASSGWGASGLLGIPMMGAGPLGPKGMLLYCIGLLISCTMGFLLTFFSTPAEKIKAQ